MTREWYVINDAGDCHHLQLKCKRINVAGDFPCIGVDKGG